MQNTELTKQEKSQNKNKKTIKILLAAFLFLFSIDGLLNFDPIGGFFTFSFAYLFGFMFFVIYAFLMFIGVYVNLKKTKKTRKNIILTVCGICFISLAVLMFSSFHIHPTVYSSLTQGVNFIDSINSTMSFLTDTNNKVKLSYSSEIGNLGGGLIGNFFVGLMTINDNYALAIVVSILISLLGIFLVVLPILNVLKNKKYDHRANNENQYTPVNSNYNNNNMNNPNYYNQNMYYNNMMNPNMMSPNMMNKNIPQTPNYQQQVVNQVTPTEVIEVKNETKNKKKNSKVPSEVEIQNQEPQLQTSNYEIKKAVEEQNYKKNGTRFSSNIEDYPVCPVDLKRNEYMEEPKKKKGGLFSFLFGKHKIKDEEDIDFKNEEDFNNYARNLGKQQNETNLFGKEVKIDYSNYSNTKNPEVEQRKKAEDINIYENDIPLTKQAKQHIDYDKIIEEHQQRQNPVISFPNDVVVEKKVNVKPTVIGTAQEEKKRYAFPPLSLLEDHMEFGKYEINNTTSFQKQERINQFFSDYKIDARVESFTVGPAVTRFNIRTSPGVRISTMASRVEELQMYLRGDKSVRVETVVEGRDTSGIEVGNAEPMIVPFKSVFNKLQQQQNPLTIALGTNIDGNTVTCNLDDLPHLLVAGTTGSGKSVFIHQVIMSLIMRNYPDQLRLILIDPKKVEFTKYQNIPHLFCRIVDDINQATAILNELVNEMERRYSLLSANQCVNLKEYRAKIENDKTLVDMPNLVCIIDEFADLISQDPDNVEYSVQRLAQKARACGIYLIIATQRPSVKVITGDIKANIPARVALSVSSQIDSRTIIDEIGAETLVGKGDLLARIPGHKSLIRCQSAFLNNNEISRVTNYLTKFGGYPKFDQRFNRIQTIRDVDSDEEFLED